MKKYLKNTLKIYIYNFKNSLTGLVVEPVKSAVKANISIEANQFCLHRFFFVFFFSNFQNVHTKVVNTYSNKINAYKGFYAFTYHFIYMHFTYIHFTYIHFTYIHFNINVVIKIFTLSFLLV